MITTVSISHLTRYRYREPVLFGEHRILVRPRESFDQRLLDASLSIEPTPARLHWVQDVFGNAVAIARFDERSAELSILARATIEHRPIPSEAITIEPYAEFYPFTYAAEDMPDLLRSIERGYRDRDREVERWARSFLHASGRTPTLDLLREMTERIHSDFGYLRREERGIQSPIETLMLGTGSCRDLAVLMMEAVRSLGFAARFVSGYLYTPGGKRERVGGRSTHAWLRVFVPGSGWVEFDPTNAICGNAGLIRVAITRDPIHATPVSGTWRGKKGSQIEMTVDVSIRLLDAALPDDTSARVAPRDASLVAGAESC